MKMTKYEKTRRKVFGLGKKPKALPKVKVPTIKKPLKRPPMGPSTRRDPNAWE